ncbi:MAG: PQQ-dependent sugar dehydrogenase [Phycisphaeraceae bacterium]|nr:PQQ-dependent sugar dehydrogenase [Phycisphaerales bacterium]MCB9860404.1 PQQ-dependent sugar dehydrogenase [Phycisphaeraceae bacterium]
MASWCAVAPVWSQPFSVTTDFEGIASTSFSVGTVPNTAAFTGGESLNSGNPALNHSGVFSWQMINAGTVGSIAFETPADDVGFWARNSVSSVAGLVQVFNPDGVQVASANLTSTFTFYTFTNVGPISRIDVTNSGGPLGSAAVVDDFGFNPVVAITDPFPDPIVKNTIRIELEEVATGLTAPHAMVDDPTGGNSLFVADQAGLVRIIDNGTLVAQPFLDVSSRLVSLGIFGTGDPFGDFDERGLIGFTFHPQYNTPGTPGFGKLYTYTSEPEAGTPDFVPALPPPVGQGANHHAVIAEWQVDSANPNLVDPTSRREIIRILEPQFNHNGGMMMFGPDDMLYIAFGDGGGGDDNDGQISMGQPMWGHGPFGNGQDNETIYGSIIRIDPLGTNGVNGQYGVPANNPFVNQQGLDEIFAYGLRNPFRFSFMGSNLIVADVGQRAIEEVNIVQAGDNLGWRLKEGSFRFHHNGVANGYIIDNLGGLPSGLKDPVIEYDHDEGISIIGGYMYNGSAIPTLSGKYVFGDFSLAFGSASGRLFYSDLNAGTINEFILGKDNRDLGLYIKGFGQDDDGEVYLLAGTNLGPFGNFGSVYKLVDVCYADCDDSGTLNIFDYICFGNDYAANGMYADCNVDGTLNIFDYICFGNAYAAGCP